MDSNAAKSEWGGNLFVLLMVAMTIAGVLFLTIGGVGSSHHPVKLPAHKEVKDICAAAMTYFCDLGCYPPDTAIFETGDVKETACDPESIYKYLGSEITDKAGKKWGPYIQLRTEYLKGHIYLDPWGNPYRLDARHAAIGEPYSAGTPREKMKCDIKVWSCGPDGKDKNGSNVIEGHGDAPEDQDNITSWAD